MGQPHSVETRCIIDEFRKHILGMLEGVASQGRQCLQFPHRLQPQAEGSPEASTPALGGENKLQSIKNDKVKNAHEKVMRRFEKFHQTIQLGDGS